MEAKVRAASEHLAASAALTTLGGACPFRDGDDTQVGIEQCANRPQRWVMASTCSHSSLRGVVGEVVLLTVFAAEVEQCGVHRRRQRLRCVFHYRGNRTDADEGAGEAEGV